MQATLYMVQTLSEKAFSMKIEEEVASMRAISSKTEVPSKVVVGYIYPSWSETQTKKLTRNLKGAIVLSPLD